VPGAPIVRETADGCRQGLPRRRLSIQDAVYPVQPLRRILVRSRPRAGGHDGTPPCHRPMGGTRPQGVLPQRHGKMSRPLAYTLPTISERPIGRAKVGTAAHSCRSPACLTAADPPRRASHHSDELQAWPARGDRPSPRPRCSTPFAFSSRPVRDVHNRQPPITAGGGGVEGRPVMPGVGHAGPAAGPNPLGDGVRPSVAHETVAPPPFEVYARRESRRAAPATLRPSPPRRPRNDCKAARPSRP